MAKRNHSKRTRKTRVKKHGGNGQENDEEYTKLVELINNHFENGKLKEPLPDVGNSMFFFSELLKMYDKSEGELKTRIGSLVIYMKQNEKLKKSLETLSQKDKEIIENLYNTIASKHNTELKQVYNNNNNNKVGGKSRKSRRHLKSKTRKSRK